MSAIQELPRNVCDAIARREIDASKLTARHIGSYLGKTTSVLYHHWGSLDGFLHAVSQAALAKLGAEVTAQLSDCPDIADVAEAFVRFGLDQPVLYHVIFERQYDWDALRAHGAFNEPMPGMQMFSSLIGFFAGAGSDEPDLDARLLYAGLHGLVSLANSGRANVGALDVTDRDMAIAAARKLAQRLTHTTSMELS